MQLKLKKGLLVITATILVVCLGTPACGNIGEDTKKASKTSASATAGNDDVASVNGVAISRYQFINALGYEQEIAAIRGVTITDEQLTEIKYQVLENLIRQELIYQESQRYGIFIDEKEIDDAYEERKQKASFETDAEFEEALKKSNKSVASYRKEIEQGLAVDRFIQDKFTNHTAVSDSEAKQYYDNNSALFQQPEQVRVSHIMIGVRSDADQSQKDEARKKIEKATERLNAGEDFASVAKEVSENVNSKDNGGDLGFLSRGQTPKSFEDAAFALKKDEISDIVDTGSGYHIIKLTDRTDARTITYEEVKNDIIYSLKTSKVNNSVDKYIKELKNKSTIVTYPIHQ